MDTFFLLEQLAHTAHHSHEKDQLINSLPLDLQTSFIKSNSQQLRRKMSASLASDFPDARTVVQG